MSKGVGVLMSKYEWGGVESVGAYHERERLCPEGVSEGGGDSTCTLRVTVKLRGVKNRPNRKPGWISTCFQLGK